MLRVMYFTNSNSSVQFIVKIRWLSYNIFKNMSYGATVRASAANSNLIDFTPGLNKFYVHCDFSKWFIDNLK